MTAEQNRRRIWKLMNALWTQAQLAGMDDREFIELATSAAADDDLDDEGLSCEAIG